MWLTNCGNKNIEISAVCFRSWLSHGCKLCKDGLFDILVGVSLDSYMLPNLLTFLRNHLVISPKSLNNENHWIWFNHKLPPSPVTDPSQCSWSHNVVITYWSHCAPLSPGLWWCSGVVCTWWRPLVYWLDTTWSAPPCPTMPCHDYLPPHQLAPLVSYSLC